MKTPSDRRAPATERRPARDRRVYKGVAASPGISVGPAFVVGGGHIGVESYSLKAPQIEEEIQRFRRAVESAKSEVRRARDKMAAAVDPQLAQIFDGHLGLLEDPNLIGATERRIRAEKHNAESVLNSVVEENAARFDRIEDKRVAAVAADLRDVGQRILSGMAMAMGRDIINPEKPSIVIAHDLSPSQTAHMEPDRVAGFATDIGGPVSHTALLAKALRIPAVVGLSTISPEVQPGDSLLLDGFAGQVIVNPTLEDLKRYRKRHREWKARDHALGRLKLLPAETRDGYVVEITANIELPSEAPQVLASGGEGIGLFRTEFLYLEEDRLPTEEEQFKVYSAVLRQMNPRPVVFRTLDLGGDKFLSEIPLSQQLNPFLGLRGIRLCLQCPDIFKAQLRAMLRASHFGKARIMFPLVTGVTQVRQARGFVEEAAAELRKEGRPFDGGIEIGAMIEVPSAALTADIIADDVDFFSIGTNDLIQYTLAVDRVNEQVAHLYNPHHPAVMRLIRDVIDAGHRHGIWVALCGEMASDPDLACLLVGMGVDELSMAASAIPAVKERIRHMSISDLRQLAEEVLQRPTSIEIRKIMGERLPELLRSRSRRG